MRNNNITTGHNIIIAQYPASVADRMIARIVDLFFITIYLTTATTFFFSIEETYSSVMDVLWLFILLAVLPALAYFPIFELLDSGRTLGKRIMGIRVVQADGSQLQFSSAVLRWVFDVLDVTMALGLPTMIFSRNNQRIGDMAADTVVISDKENNYQSFDTSVYDFAYKDYTPVYPEAAGLTTNQLEIIKRVLLFDRDPVIHQDYLNRLANKVVAVLDVRPQPGMDAPAFLNVVLTDYMYYASLPVEL